MQFYDFEVLRGDDVIASEISVALENSRGAWPRVVGIARTLNLPGCRIRVREHEGDTVILIGAMAALRFPEGLFRGSSDSAQIASHATPARARSSMP